MAASHRKPNSHSGAPSVTETTAKVVFMLADPDEQGERARTDRLEMASAPARAGAGRRSGFSQTPVRLG
jgi:hypothetical protein